MVGPKLIICLCKVFGISLMIDWEWRQIHFLIPFIEIIINWDGSGFKFQNLFGSRG